VVLGLYWKRVTTSAVFAGLVAGVATAWFLMLSHQDPLHGLSAGFLALCLNFLIVVAVSLGTPGKDIQPMQALT
jgi:SSS family solute:Na+ symporter